MKIRTIHIFQFFSICLAMALIGRASWGQEVSEKLLFDLHQGGTLSESLQSEIKSVLDIYNEVSSLLQSDVLTTSEREFSYCQPYIFPTIWPENEIIFEPKVAFQADNPCPEEIRVEVLNLRVTLSEAVELEVKDQEVVFDFNPNGRQERKCSLAVFNDFKVAEIPVEFTEQMQLTDYHTLYYLTKNEIGGSGGAVFILQGILNIADTLYRVEGRDQEEFPSKGGAKFCLELFGRLEPQLFPLH